jgi:hypothetical protein
VARKNSIERPKPREEPGSERWPVFFWLCRVEVTVHGQDVQTFIDDQQGQMSMYLAYIIDPTSLRIYFNIQLV